MRSLFLSTKTRNSHQDRDAESKSRSSSQCNDDPPQHRSDDMYADAKDDVYRARVACRLAAEFWCSDPYEKRPDNEDKYRAEHCTSREDRLQGRVTSVARFWDDVNAQESEQVNNADGMEKGERLMRSLIYGGAEQRKPLNAECRLDPGPKSCTIFWNADGFNYGPENHASEYEGVDTDSDLAYTWSIIEHEGVPFCEGICLTPVPETSGSAWIRHSGIILKWEVGNQYTSSEAFDQKFLLLMRKLK
jgi:hypothetical protein